jgi:Xaa-Pro aminopeptidase
MFSKRAFLKYAAGGLAGASAAPLFVSSSTAANSNTSTPPGDVLQSITTDAQAISVTERKARVAKLQRQMQAWGVGALLIEPGSSMVYFSGVRWWRSERLTALVVPAEGEIAFVTPHFEEPSVRESMSFGDDVRTWHEHENPYELVASIVKDRGVKPATIAFEDTVRTFVYRGVLEALSGFEVVSGRDVVLACRMFKSEQELQLMRKANEVTLTAYAETYKRLEVGMSREDISSMMARFQTQLGGTSLFAMALIGESSAYPHGSDKTAPLAEGDVLLMDCGAQLLDYESDISRTFVIGEPSKRQREVWGTVRKGQQIAFEAATLGTPAGKVDDAVRAYYESLGYGPGYRTPGLSHRTGHGIGMDGHEMVNFVHGETTPLQAGMCFSNEPGLYHYGEFGVRLEDCLYMTEKGARWFTEPPVSLDEPLGRMG